MKKVAIYVRVSTSGQELDNQLLQLRKYCDKSDWEVYKEYCDIVSGKEESRPEYDKLFIDAHKKLYDGVLFWTFDRFARSGTLFTLQKLKELDNEGIFWHSYQEQYISSIGPWKDVVISIFATIAKLERERISERTKAGLERAKAKGKKLGRPGIPKEVEEQVLDYIRQGLSYSKISEKVIYKIKFGKERHISAGQISQIKKKHSEKGGLNITQEK